MAAYSINTANVRQSSSATGPGSVIAGEDILAGRPVYLNTTTGYYMRANALISNAPGGIAASSANANQYFTVISGDPNFSCGFTINAGEIAVLGNAPGQINPSSDTGTGWYVHVLGVGIGNNNINLKLTGSNASHA